MIDIIDSGGWYDQRLDPEYSGRDHHPLARARDRVVELTRVALPEVAATLNKTENRDLAKMEQVVARRKKAEEIFEWAVAAVNKFVEEQRDDDLVGTDFSDLTKMREALDHQENFANFFTEGELKPLEAALKIAEEALEAATKLTDDGAKEAAYNKLEGPFVALRTAAENFRLRTDETYVSTRNLYSKIETGTRLKAVGRVASIASLLTVASLVAIRMGAFAGRVPTPIKGQAALLKLSPTVFAAVAIAPPAVSLALWGGGKAVEKKSAIDLIEAVYVERQVRKVEQADAVRPDSKVRGRILDRQPNHPALMRELDRMLPEPSYFEYKRA